LFFKPGLFRAPAIFANNKVLIILYLHEQRVNRDRLHKNIPFAGQAACILPLQFFLLHIDAAPLK